MKRFARIIIMIIVILICNFNITTYAENEKTKDTSSVTANNNKTFSNGIYNIAVGKNSNKSIEVAGSIKENNGKIDIWDYRKCTSSEILF